MRWDELFRDLESQLDAAGAAELAAEVADRTRREVATLSLVDRARGAVGHPVRVQLLGVGALAGMLLQVGAEWLLLRDAAGRDVLVPWSAVVTVAGLGVASGAPGEGGEVFRRLGLGWALRAVVRDRALVSLGLVDGSVVSGTLDRVGSDFVELSEHPVGEARRAAQISAVRAIVFSRIASVTRLP
ncbi:MAG: hypothetical protein ACXV2H_11660 [Actinomycetes bacterium]